MGSKKEIALITGASGGIGYELAKLFAEEGHPLLLIARSREKLLAMAEDFKKQYGVPATVLTKDLARPGAAEEIFDFVQSEGIVVEYLVNNAGVGALGKFAEIEAGLQFEMIELNVTTLTRLARLFLPGMIKRGSGKILNVASTAGFQPGPFMAVYYATKAYVLSFSEALAEELRGTGVTVTCLCPGHTATDFQRRAAIGEIPLLRFGRMDARKVAECGWRGMMEGKTLVVTGFLNRLFVQSLRLAPRRLVPRVVRLLQESRKG